MSDDDSLDDDLRWAKIVLERQRSRPLSVEQAGADVTLAYQLLERFVAEIERTRLDVIRAVVRYTMKGYIAGEHADVKAWRERAEAAGAEVARRQAEIERLRPWKDAIVDACVVDWIFTAEHDTDPRFAVNDLLAWQQQIALDPAVSTDAKELHDRIAWHAAEITRLEAALTDERVRQGETLREIERLRAVLPPVVKLAADMASYAHHSGFPVYDGGHTEPEAQCPHADCNAVRTARATEHE